MPKISLEKLILQNCSITVALWEKPPYTHTHTNASRECFYKFIPSSVRRIYIFWRRNCISFTLPPPTIHTLTPYTLFSFLSLIFLSITTPLRLLPKSRHYIYIYIYIIHIFVCIFIFLPPSNVIVIVNSDCGGGGGDKKENKKKLYMKP